MDYASVKFHNYAYYCNLCLIDISGNCYFFSQLGGSCWQSRRCPDGQVILSHKSETSQGSTAKIFNSHFGGEWLSVRPTQLKPFCRLLCAWWQRLQKHFQVQTSSIFCGGKLLLSICMKTALHADIAIVFPIVSWSRFEFNSKVSKTNFLPEGQLKARRINRRFKISRCNKIRNTKVSRAELKKSGLNST